MRYVGVDFFFTSSCLGFAQHLDLYVCVCACQTWGIFSHCFAECFSRSACFSFPSGTVMTQMLDVLLSSHRFPEALFILGWAWGLIYSVL